MGVVRVIQYFILLKLQFHSMLRLSKTYLKIQKVCHSEDEIMPELIESVASTDHELHKVALG